MNADGFGLAQLPWLEGRYSSDLVGGQFAVCEGAHGFEEFVVEVLAVERGVFADGVADAAGAEEFAVDVLCVGQAVGVENDFVARFQLDLVDDELGGLDHTYRQAVCFEEAPASVGFDDYGSAVAGVDPTEAAGLVD